jgi:tRNA(fMet)-specific endonuclease VapC
MMRLCLDTSAYSNFKSGDPQTVSIISSAKDVGVPAIVLGELRGGFALGSRREKNEAELRSFLDSPPVRVLEVNEETSQFYAQIFVELRQGGTPIPTNDMWIAAMALQEGATILTCDSHFELIRCVGTRLMARV